MRKNVTCRDQNSKQVVEADDAAYPLKVDTAEGAQVRLSNLIVEERNIGDGPGMREVAVGPAAGDVEASARSAATAD